MAPALVHLPNGQTLTVTAVFGGLSFKSNELNIHQSAFPPGWTIVIQSQDELDPASGDDAGTGNEHISSNIHTHRYRLPTLQRDEIFISSISNPSNSDFKPPTSPSRQIAMMLWATLWWYFHQPAPKPQLSGPKWDKLPEEGRPRGEWRLNIKREGIFKGKHLLPKLERMGLISTEDTAVGTALDARNGEGWTKMFVSQRSFWQLDPRIFLFTLSPTIHSPFPGASPYPSRPSSPNRNSAAGVPLQSTSKPGSPRNSMQGLWSPPATVEAGPFTSSSHLPTYYPPPPLQYTMTNSVRHPIRPKPPGQGEVFYTRYVPSVGQYLSFRTASLSPKAPVYKGPVSNGTPNFLPPHSGVSTGNLPSIGNMAIHPCDTDLLYDWMNNPRVNAFWGEAGSWEHQESFLQTALKSKHSFPVIGLWDGKPFGYFEIYWVKEDTLGRYIPGREYKEWDRGFHALVGEEEFRGEYRAKVWISALLHYCWVNDPRTESVFVEPRRDNDKLIKYCEMAGFHKNKEIAFPHKQASLLKINREAWSAPFL